MRLWGIRSKVVVWVALVTALALTVFAVGVAYHLYTESLRGMDRDLHKFGRRLLKTVSHLPVPWGANPEVMELALQTPVRVWFRVVDAKGALIYESKDFPTLVPDRHEPGKPWTETAGPGEFRNVDFYGDGLWVRSSASMDEVDEVWEDLLISYGFALPLSLMVISVGGFWLANRALAPVGKIARTAETITAQRLSQRLPVPAGRDEVAQLSEVLNRMIDRLESGYHQARSFSADASHQIKTPLTVIRGEIENILRSGSRHEAALLRVLDEVSGLAMMTDRLLFLSRGDTDQIHLKGAMVNIRELLTGLQEDFSAFAEERRISLNLEGGDDAGVFGDASLLRQLFANLLENAIKYNRPDGRVTVGISRDTVRVIVRVINDGRAIPASERSHIFQRFHRGEEGQSGPAGHGLGLSIALEIATLHGGSLALVRSESDQTEFCVELPISRKITSL